PAVLAGWRRGMEVPGDIAVAYLLQCSFYGHALYATAYMDTWRKDSLVMLLHHVVALTLIAASYAFREKASSRNSAPNRKPHPWAAVTIPGGELPCPEWGGDSGKCPLQPRAVPEGPCPSVPPQYIVLFVAKVLLGQVQEVNDVREYDVEESRK
ncbi:CERS1 synthase, partial [Rhabdornis inornatus]|nr:CERS1 synthase [Rhabdornis inornatus]